MTVHRYTEKKKIIYQDIKVKNITLCLGYMKRKEKITRCFYPTIFPKGKREIDFFLYINICCFVIVYVRARSYRGAGFRVLGSSLYAPILLCICEFGCLASWFLLSSHSYKNFPLSWNKWETSTSPCILFYLTFIIFFYVPLFIVFEILINSLHSFMLLLVVMFSLVYFRTGVSNRRNQCVKKIAAPN